MMPVTNTHTDVYEGNDPYIFISYSHKDQKLMNTVKEVLKSNSVRYWYDNGLHSGDDWNMIIAKRLKGSTICLLLLSTSSAESDYVKNELAFALSHRIPIHTLQIEDFTLPLDIEMMTGRIQRLVMNENYQAELIKSLPPEIFYNLTETSQSKTEYSHPLFKTSEFITERQGTKIFLGKHNRLDYNCTILEDLLKTNERSETENMLRVISKVTHPLFPKIIDYGFDEHRIFIYQEYNGVSFLDKFLSENQLDEDSIINIITEATEGISYLYKLNLVFRDFSRGSLIVTNNNKLNIFRLYHPYYGLIKAAEENKQYYFYKELQELSILMAQLCLGKEPVLPIRIINEERFSKSFLFKMNLIIQKCTKENGIPEYRSFDELISDLKSNKFTNSDKRFLKKRKKKLCDYEKAHKQRSGTFISSDSPSNTAVMPSSLEEQFGFEGTVLLNEPSAEFFDISNSQQSSSDMTPQISIYVFASGKTFNFNKEKIFVGRGNTCDLILTQPSISRIHFSIARRPDNTYIIKDLNASNGVFIVTDAEECKRIPNGQSELVPSGTIIRLGGLDIKII